MNRLDRPLPPWSPRAGITSALPGGGEWPYLIPGAVESALAQLEPGHGLG
ncbi:hypothetical protein WDD9_001748 [Paenibacillus melissococcoides]|nr:hypothetical protein [Paenibacillus melissococcoides]CAH8707847.1 hypothetical protein WDD9_001748 [Paenibacillus melissococcoides]